MIGAADRSAKTDHAGFSLRADIEGSRSPMIAAAHADPADPGLLGLGHSEIAGSLEARWPRPLSPSISAVAAVSVTTSSVRRRVAAAIPQAIDILAKAKDAVGPVAEQVRLDHHAGDGAGVRFGHGERLEHRR